MPLISCPDCGKSISDAASACIHCGRPLQAVSDPVAVGHPRHPATDSSFACPKCGSDNVQKLSIAHATGLSTVAATTEALGVGVTGEGLGGGMASATTSGTQQTTLSKSIAPPSKRVADAGEYLGLGCGTMLLALLLVAATDVGTSGFWGAVVLGVMVGMVVWAIREAAASKWNETEWPKLKAKWDRSLMCMRCGESWERR